MLPNLNTSVLVGMSGGVDSSVAAALLVEAGYRTVGVMLRLWQVEGTECDNRCCTPEAMVQARQVAAMLGIPFYVLDTREMFRRQVVEKFIEGSISGITPNPCFICNQNFRWNTLLKHATEMGLDKVASGHYARLRNNGDGFLELLRGTDDWKDQSYMLCGLNQTQLKRTIFPLGGFLKRDVREKARSLGLPVAEREESQDLCFLGKQDTSGFLNDQAPEALQAGIITDSQGKQLGHHQGLAQYTIGQRKGLGISSDRPLYVLHKDVVRHILVVGYEEELGGDELTIAEINWIHGEMPQKPFSSEVKIRYKAAEVSAEITPLPGGRAHVRFSHKIRDITPGQIAAFYQGEICQGGGVIQL